MECKRRKAGLTTSRNMLNPSVINLFSLLTAVALGESVSTITAWQLAPPKGKFLPASYARLLSLHRKHALRRSVAALPFQPRQSTGGYRDRVGRVLPCRILVIASRSRFVSALLGSLFFVALPGRRHSVNSGRGCGNGCGGRTEFLDS